MIMIRNILIFCFAIAALLSPFSSQAQTGPANLNVNGMLFLPSGTPVTQSSVNFRLEVWDKGSTCILYSEDHLAQDLSGSKGGFSLAIGKGTSPTNFLESSSSFTTKLFENTGAVAGGWPNCPSGTTLNSGDERVVRISYDLGSGLVAMSPDVPIASSAFAMVADTLQGKRPTDFVQLKDDATYDLNQANVENVFSATNYARLEQLLNPTSSLGFGSQRLTSVADPSAAQDAATKNYTDTRLAGQTIDLQDVAPGFGGGKVLTWDQAQNKWVAQAPTISGVAGGDLTGSYPNPSVAVGAIGTSKLADNAVTSAKINSTGVAPNRILISDTISGATVTYATCANDEILKYVTGTGWQCATVSSLSAVTSVAGKTGAVTLNALDISGLGTAALHNVGVGATEIPQLNGSGKLANSVIPAFLGDVTGAVDANIVVALQGRPLASTAPNNDEVLRWNGSRWEPQALTDNGITALTGDISASGNGSVMATLTNGVVTTPKMFANPGVNRLVATDNSSGGTLVPFVCNLNETMQWTASGWSCTTVGTLLGTQFIVDGGNARGADIRIGTSDAHALNLITSGASRLHIGTTGWVGIGTTAPAQAFDLNGSMTTNGSIYMTSGGNTGRIWYDGVLKLDNGSNTTRVMGPLQVDGNAYLTTGNLYTNASSLNFYASQAGGTDNPIRFYSNNGSNERMRIDAAGNVGIGTTSPTALLHLKAGTASANSAPLKLTAGTNLTTPEAGAIEYDGSSLYYTDSGNVRRSLKSTITSSTSFTYNDVVSYYAGGTNVGTMVITMPNGWNATMLRIVIRGYDYSGTTGSWEAVVSGYNYSVVPGWYNYSTEIYGRAPFSSVRLGYDGTKNVILLGTTTTSWSYPIIRVEEVQTSYSGAGPSWATGWTITKVTSESYTNVVTPTIASWVASGSSTSFSGNVGVGTTSPNRLLEIAGPIRIQPAVLPASPAAGDLAFDSTGNSLKFHNGTNWQTVGTSSATGDFMANGSVPMTGNLRLNGNYLSGDGDSEGVFVDSSGKVGIGTTNPGYPLDVNGSVGLGSRILMQRDGANYSWIQAQGSGSDSEKSALGFGSDPTTGQINSLTFSTSNTARLLVDSSGNVGIGTTSPASKLNVDGSAITPWNAILRIDQTGSTGVTGPYGLVIGDKAQDTLSYRGLRMWLDNAGNGLLESHVNGAWKNILLAPGGGNVGIGTTSPQTALDVSGAIAQRPVAGGSTSNFLQTNAGNVSSTTNLNPGLLVFGGPSGGYVYGVDLGYGNSRYRTRTFTPDSSDISFATYPNGVPPTAQGNFTDRMVIRGDTGNVGIGTTSPGARLDISTASADPSLTASTGILELSPTGGGPDLSFGAYNASPWAAWIQTKRTTNDGTTWPLVLNPLGGNVGIGTTSPSRSLQVAGAMRLSPTANPASPAAGDIYIDSGASNLLKYHNGSNWISLSSGGSGDFMANGSVQMTGNIRLNNNWLSGDGGNEGVFVTSAGNVGVGTTSPNYPLQVQGGGSTIGTEYILSRFDYSGAGNAGVAFGYYYGASAVDYAQVRATGGVPLALSTSGGNGQVVLTTAGNLGVGTSAPSARLHSLPTGAGTLGLLIGNSTYSSSAFNAMGMQINDSGVGIIRAGWATAKDLLINDTGGNVGIGTSLALSRLHLLGTSGAYNQGLALQGNGSSNPSYIWNNSSGNINFAGNGQSSPVMTVTNSYVGIGTTAPATNLDVVGDIQFTGSLIDASDRRLKENIREISGGLDVVRKIQTYSFTMKDDPKKQVEFGVMAQEMKEILPDIVHIINPKMGYMGVNYVSLIPWSIRAIQEIDRDVAALKERVNTLEEQNRQLERKNKNIEEKLDAILKRLDKK